MRFELLIRAVVALAAIEEPPKLAYFGICTEHMITPNSCNMTRLLGFSDRSDLMLAWGPQAKVLLRLLVNLMPDGTEGILSESIPLFQILRSSISSKRQVFKSLFESLNHVRVRQNMHTLVIALLVFFIFTTRKLFWNECSTLQKV